MKLLLSQLSLKVNFLCKSIVAATVVKDSWHSMRKCDVLLVCHDNDRGYSYHNKAYSQLLDSVGDLCARKGLSTSTIAIPYSQLVGVHAHNTPVSYNRSALIIALVGIIIRLIRGRIVALDWMNKNLVNIWVSILEQTNPKCVIGIQPSPYLCQAGKIKSVRVYDLEHGVIADEHPWYGQNYRADTPTQYLPDGFLCWHERSAEVLYKWTQQKHIDVIVIGNPWFLRFLDADKNDVLVQETISFNKIFKNNNPTILVSLQWGLINEFAKSGLIEESGVFIVNALEQTILETADLYNWLLRLHPVQIRGSEKKATQQYLTKTFKHLHSVEWQVCSEMPLPVLLKQVDLHISYSSTVTVEAAWMGIRTGLMDPSLTGDGCYSSYFTYERSLGMAEILPLDPKIIKDWIAKKLNQGKGISTLQNSSQSIHSFIEKIAVFGIDQSANNTIGLV